MRENHIAGPATLEDAAAVLRRARSEMRREAIGTLAGTAFAIAAMLVVGLVLTGGWMPPWWGWLVIGVYTTGLVEALHDLAAITTGRMTFDTELDDGTVVHFCGRRRCPHHPEVTP